MCGSRGRWSWPGCTTRKDFVDGEREDVRGFDLSHGMHRFRKVGEEK